MSLLERFSVWL